MTRPSTQASEQYATTDRLTARIGIHEYGTGSETWWEFLSTRLTLAGRVLEVGAGTGELWRHITPPAGITLVDFTEAMCRRLRSVPGARVVRADAAALPFADGSFDTLIANHMLYHVDDVGAALRSFARVLAPGGRVVIATNGDEHMAELYDLHPTLTRMRLNDFDAAHGPAAVAQVFSGVTSSRFHNDLAVPAAQPIVDYMNSWSGTLSPADLATIRAKVTEQIAAEGTFAVRRHTVLITGTA